jgi:hypothetical protein
MEIAIPLLALGSMYVASNQKKNATSAKENYENMGRRANYLPNTSIPVSNYPITQPNTGSNVNQFQNANAATDRYFARDVDFGKMSAGVAGGVGGVGIMAAGGGSGASVAGGAGFDNKTQFGDAYDNASSMSLTGAPIDPSQFKHNNMVPYFGAKIRGRTANPNANETVLDNKGGSGSQYIAKTELAPLFSPHENLHVPNGMQNHSDFFQSRMLPSMKMANVKPFEEQRVGPGLDQGFTVGGTGGFNSGLDARDKWMDRTVDELRVKTNPKLSYSLQDHQGPARHFVQSAPTAQTQGRMEKHLPDTFFVNTPDRWLTTTGLEKGQTIRSVEVEKDVNRTTTTAEYFGTTANPFGSAMPAPETYEDSKRQEYDGKPMINPYAADRAIANEADYGRDSYTFTNNNRTTVRAPEMGGIHGAIRAVVAPLLDVLRPSRKENAVGNLRQYENAKSTVSGGVVFNPADRLPTTIKETTVGLVGFDHLNVERQAASGYLVSPQTPFSTERETTSTNYVGPAGGSATHMGNQVYNSAYNQRNNVNKTQKGRPNGGNMALFNGNANIHVNRLDSDRDNNRWWAPSAGPSSIPGVEMHGKMTMPQSYDNSINNERINPELLNAFRQNPYTHSLHAY